MRSILNKLGVAALVATCFSVSAQASTVEVLAFDMGTYDWDGEHVPDRTGVFIDEYFVRNFFVFDFSTVVLDNIQSAKFVVDNNYGELAPGYSMTFKLSQLSTSVSQLIAGATNRIDIYNDLADGIVYGSRTLSSLAGTESDFAIDFNADGLAALKNANVRWGFGGSLSSTDPAQQSLLFGDVYSAKLVITYADVTTTPVPEPDTTGMLMLGGLLLGATRLRKSK
jgi:hypothetical protein